jgi:hypothetical protein
MGTVREQSTDVPAWSDVAEQWFKAYRAGFDTLLAVGSAAVAGAERTHMAQIEADVETQTQNRETALAAAGARDLNALVALQSRLAQGYLENSVRYWSTCAQLARDTQAEIAGILFARLDEWNRLAQGAFRVPGAVPPPLATALDAARASQEAMLKSVAALASAGGARRDKAA